MTKKKTEAKDGKLKASAEVFDLPLSALKTNDEQELSRTPGLDRIKITAGCPLLKAGRNNGILNRVIRPDGAPTPTEEQWTALLNEDIPEIKKKEEAKRSEEAKAKLAAFEAVVEAAPKLAWPSLWELLLSPDENTRMRGYLLVRQFDPDLIEFADNLAKNGQLQPIAVRPVWGEEGTDQENTPTGEGWNVIGGLRRSIALALRHAKDPGEFPATVRCIHVAWVGDRGGMVLAGMASNDYVKPSPIDQARYFKFLKNKGLTDREVEERTGFNVQTIKTRRMLLTLPQEVQDQVHEGTLPAYRALVMAQQRAVEETKGAGDTPPAPTTGKKKPAPRVGRNQHSAMAGSRNRNAGERRRYPGLTALWNYYLLTDTEKPENDPVTKKPWVEGYWERFVLKEDIRESVAFIMGEEYKTRAELRKEQKAQAKEKQEQLKAEQARAIADQS